MPGYVIPVTPTKRQSAEGVPKSIDLPLAPVELHFLCKPTCPHVETSFALVDSGSDGTFWPAEALPPHVKWDRLQRTSTRMASFLQRKIETRPWFVELRVLGYTITKQVFVIEPDADATKIPVLGRDSLFQRFHVAFALSSSPGLMEFVPIGQVGALPEPAWPAHRDVTLQWWTWAGIEAPEPVQALPEAPRPVPGVLRPNRAQRRALKRVG